MQKPHRPDELLTAPFTTRTARAAGLTPRQLQGGGWRRLISGVYVAAETPDSLELRAAAVSLVLPPGAAVGYRTAAWLYGADVLDIKDDRVQVIATRGDQIRIAGVSASSAQLLPDDVVEVRGVPLTTPVRTAFDLARQPHLVEAVTGLDAVLATGLCTADDVSAYLPQCFRWRGVRRAALALTHAEPLVQSPMESRQRMALVLAGLPRPQAQVPVLSAEGVPFAYIDNAYERWKVGADYDGYVHAENWRQDLERQERIRARAWWHRRYTLIDARNGWRQTIDDVGRALVRAGWRPPG